MFLQYFAVTFKLKNVEVMKRHIVTNARPSDTFHHEAHFQKPFRDASLQKQALIWTNIQKLWSPGSTMLKILVLVVGTGV